MDNTVWALFFIFSSFCFVSAWKLTQEYFESVKDIETFNDEQWD